MRTEKIIFVNPNPAGAKGIHRGTVYPPLGLVYLATVLKQHGFPSRIIDANIKKLSPEQIIQDIREEDPWIIGITANILTYKAALSAASALKAAFPQAVVVLGGPHPSSVPEHALNHPFVDLVVVGEGEVTVLEMVKALKNKGTVEGVPGVVFKKENLISHNPPRPLIDNLDTLPIPEMSFLPPLSLYKMRSRAKPVGAILTSRGCIHGCIYCNKKIFGLRFRPRSPEHVMREIDYLVEDVGIRQLDVLDDFFNRDLPRAKQILRAIIARHKNRLTINFQNGLRADNVDQEFLDLMEESGVFKVDYGVESADPAVMRRIHKNLDLDKLLSTVRATQRKGIAVHCNFMFGLPGDNPQSMRRTLDYAKKVSADIASFTIAIPFPGTRLYEEVRASGKVLIETDGGVDHGYYGSRVFYETGCTRAKDVLRFYRKACLEFYCRPAQAWRILRNVRSLSELRWICEGMVSGLRNLAA